MMLQGHFLSLKLNFERVALALVSTLKHLAMPAAIDAAVPMPAESILPPPAAMPATAKTYRPALARLHEQPRLWVLKDDCYVGH